MCYETTNVTFSYFKSFNAIRFSVIQFETAIRRYIKGTSVKVVFHCDVALLFRRRLERKILSSCRLGIRPLGTIRLSSKHSLEEKYSRELLSSNTIAIRMHLRLNWILKLYYLLFFFVMYPPYRECNKTNNKLLIIIKYCNNCFSEKVYCITVLRKKTQNC